VKIGVSQDLFTVGYAGANLRQVTSSRTTAANTLSDDGQGWVFEWIDESSFWFSGMRDGWHQRIRGTDQAQPPDTL
jgi:hypothetical protein